MSTGAVGVEAYILDTSVLSAILMGGMSGMSA